MGQQDYMFQRFLGILHILCVCVFLETLCAGHVLFQRNVLNILYLKSILHFTEHAGLPCKTSCFSRCNSRLFPEFFLVHKSGKDNLHSSPLPRYEVDVMSQCGVILGKFLNRCILSWVLRLCWISFSQHAQTHNKQNACGPADTHVCTRTHLKSNHDEKHRCQSN